MENAFSSFAIISQQAFLIRNTFRDEGDTRDVIQVPKNEKVTLPTWAKEDATFKHILSLGKLEILGNPSDLNKEVPVFDETTGLISFKGKIYKEVIAEPEPEILPEPESRPEEKPKRGRPPQK